MTDHTVYVLVSHPRDDDGLTDTSRTVYRARCATCGWRSVRNLARTVAEREAQRHAEATTAGHTRDLRLDRVSMATNGETEGCL